MSAPAKPRGRACESCSKIKIKCELGSSNNASPPCERCVRLNKSCVLVQRIKQKDRVAELESQVAALTRLLEAQGIRDIENVNDYADDTSDGPPIRASGLPHGVQPPKKRRLSSQTLASTNGSVRLSEDIETQTSSALSSQIMFLDSITSQDQQQQVLDKYLDEMLPIFPLVHLSGDCSLHALRSQRPALLKAIIFAASPGILTLDIQDEICRDLLDELVDRAITKGQKSLELVLAMQIACLWFRSPRRHTRVTAFQLIQVASDAAVDLGFGSNLLGPLFVQPVNTQSGVDTSDACRAWLTCYVLSASMSVLIRSASPWVWTPEHEASLLFLEYSTASDSDRWCGQFIRGQHLCEDIVTRMRLCDMSVLTKVPGPEARTDIQRCRHQIMNFKMMIPSTLHHPGLIIWEHIAAAYLHEFVLHTPTNKHLFAAPFVVERLSVTDFPTPAVTEDHITSLFELLAAVQAIIDMSSQMSVIELMAYPGLLYASRAAYAMLILAKLYVATTAPGNTYGSVLPPETIRMPEYIEKLVRAADQVHAVDARSGASRILGSSHRVQEWFSKFSSSIATMVSSTTPPLQMLPDIDASDPALNLDGPVDWDTLLAGADYSFDIPVAEPLVYDEALYTHKILQNGP